MGKLTLPFLLMTAFVCAGCESGEPQPNLGYAAATMTRTRMLEHRPRPFSHPFHEQPALPVRRRDPFADETKDLDDEDPLFLLGMALVVGVAFAATGIKRLCHFIGYVVALLLVSLLLGVICAAVAIIALPLAAGGNTILLLLRTALDLARSLVFRLIYPH